MRPDASSATTSIWPRPMVLPLAMVAGGAAAAGRINASEAAPPTRTARRGSQSFPVLVILFSSPGRLIGPLVATF